MNIEYAHFSNSKAFFHKKDYSDIINSNFYEIVKAYESIESEYVTYAYNQEAEYNRNMYLFENKRCSCGKNLRYISGYNFWGCPDYKDGKEHKVISHEPYLYIKRFNPHWCTEILDKTGLRGKANAKGVLKILLDNGYDDLRKKYSDKTTADAINNFIKANERSKYQEQTILAFLKKIYGEGNVLYQQQIDYKLSGGRDSFCRPDFICRRENERIIIDAKLNYPDDEQMTLYVELLKFIYKKTGKDIKVVGRFYIKQGGNEYHNIKSNFDVRIF